MRTYFYTIGVQVEVVDEVKANEMVETLRTALTVIDLEGGSTYIDGPFVAEEDDDE